MENSLTRAKLLILLPGSTNPDAITVTVPKTAAPGGAPGELDPAVVAEETLAALGTGPMVIPGTFNRFASFLMRRLMPRTGTIRLMGAQTRKLLRWIEPTTRVATQYRFKETREVRR